MSIRRQSTLLYVITGLSVTSPSLLALDGGNPVFLKTPDETRGWKTFELLSYQDELGSLAKENFAWSSELVDWDGLGAHLADDSTLRIYMNHEEHDASFSRVDVNLENLKIWIDEGIEDNTSFNQVAAPGEIVKAVSRGWLSIATGSSQVLDRPCSGNVWSAETYGDGLGFADDLYLLGEETSADPSLNRDAGHIWVMDLATRILYEASDLGDGRWENAALIDTGRSDTVALLLSEDIGGGSAGALNGTAPLRLYVGEKDSTGDFLARNGLRSGKIYHWNPSSTTSTNGTITNGTTSDIFGNGFSTTVTGTWLEDAAEAVLFAKSEDVHPNVEPASPGYGKEAVLASQGEGIFKIDFSQLDFIQGDLGQSRDSDVSVLYVAAKQDYTTPFSKMDNLVWATDGMIYVNEDDGEGDMWRVDPVSLEASFAAPDFDPATFIPNRSQVTYILDADFAKESSGVIEISQEVNYPPGSVFLATAQDASPTKFNQLALIVAPTNVLSYSASFGGSISGVTRQRVLRENDGSTVTALASPGYAFVGWSDGLLTASRTDLEVSEDVMVTAHFVPNDYLTWVNNSPTLTGLEILPEEDPDEDGISNLIEYGSNLDPGRSDFTTLETTTGESGFPLVEIRSVENEERLVVEYLERVDTSALSYAVEFSEEPGFLIISSGNEVSRTTINSTWERVVVRDLMHTNAEQRRFARVRISSP